MNTIEYVAEKQHKDYEKGKKSQKLFMDLMGKNGYRCYSADTFQDTNEHWDVVTVKDTENGGKIFERFDVKGLKECVSEGFEWVELMTVDGRKGWLYSEYMNSLAFELNDYFILIKRIELVPIIETNIAIMDKLDEEAGERIPLLRVIKDGLLNYQRYSRILWGKNDVVVKAPIKDFEHLTFAKLYKKDGKLEMIK
jgi:hypothetical protein